MRDFDIILVKRTVGEALIARYYFQMLGREVILDSYVLKSYVDKPRAGTVVETYSRLFKRDSTVKNVIVPNDVALEAVVKMKEQITFKES